MTLVVAEPCHDCKYTDCVTVCPVECFYEDEHMLYIDPKECIDCGACVSECPVQAIFAESDLPAKWRHYAEVNARRSAELIALDTGHITERKEPKEGPGCVRPG